MYISKRLILFISFQLVKVPRFLCAFKAGSVDKIF